MKKEKIIFFEDWPAQSPDLNPIEHLWHHVKIRLGAYETPAKNVKELMWERFDYEWNQFIIEKNFSLTIIVCRIGFLY